MRARKQASLKENYRVSEAHRSTRKADKDDRTIIDDDLRVK